MDGKSYFKCITISLLIGIFVGVEFGGVIGLVAFMVSALLTVMVDNVCVAIKSLKTD